MRIFRMVLSGFAGALAVTAAHQAVKKFVPDAPRMDVLGLRSVEELCLKFGWEPPQGATLFRSPLVADLISNSIYYSPIGASRGATAVGKGISMGIAAGLGAGKIPQLLGLSKPSGDRSTTSVAMTVGLYVLGGLVAASVASFLSPRDR